MRRTAILVFALACLIGVLGSGSAAASTAIPDSQEAVPGGYLVGFNAFPGGSEAALIRAHGGQVGSGFRTVPAVVAQLPDQAVDALRRNPRVAYVEPDYLRRATDLELTAAWSVALIGAGAVHGSNTGSGVVVAIVDTGINCTHTDLACDLGAGRDFIASEGGSAIVPDSDEYGHGTHVAGTVAALANGTGVVGVAPGATLVPVKVCDANGSCPTSRIIAGVEYASAVGIKVVNMSLGSRFASTAERTAMDAAAANGVVLVAAAGNAGNCSGNNNAVEYPGGYDSVIAVAAVNQDLQRACFSSSGPQVELSAPGVSVYSTWTDGGYKTGSGTSMAAPHVAGTVALLLASDLVDKSPSAIRLRLQQTAQDLGPSGRDIKFGFGLVRADLAAGVIEPPPPPAIGTIAGQVTDGAGLPIGSAVVTADTGETTSTAVDGSYTLEVPAGNRTLTVTATGFKSATATANVSEGETAKLDFTLAAATNKGKKPR